MMSDLLDILQSFNRKERFYLVGEALGNPQFTLSSQFLSQLDELFNLQIPDDAFVAMDYHLDWLYASLFLHDKGSKDGIHPRTNGVITANQEDSDLLIAYKDQDIYHILLLEAKCATGYTNKQMNSKVIRLGKVFDHDGTRWPFAKPHFALISRHCPSQLRTDDWPTWMKINGDVPRLKLPMPEGLVRVTRCDGRGKPDKDGQYWRVVKG